MTMIQRVSSLMIAPLVALLLLQGPALAELPKPPTALRSAVSKIVSSPVVNRVRWLVQRARHRPTVDSGVVAGRFQVMHNGHLRYMLAAAKDCKHLVVGITNPDPWVVKDEAVDPARSKPENNPLTYYQRMTMVQAALREAGLRPGVDFSVVPLAINYPERFKHYLPAGATCYFTDFDGWGEEKLRKFETQGFKTNMLYKKPKSEKDISATQVRNRMIAGEPWEHLVPRAVAKLMKRWKTPEQLRAGLGVGQAMAPAPAGAQ